MMHRDILLTRSVGIMDRENLNTYLHPTEAIESDNDDIREIARRLTTGLHSLGQRSVALFYFVRDEIHCSVYMISTVFLEDGKPLMGVRVFSRTWVARSVEDPHFSR
jgi:transglutaminase-like putative cysteine protease